MIMQSIVKKKVTIIIPAYNVEKYIEECLYSVCSQTYSNLQIIVVDDGSTDMTLGKIKRFSDDDKRIIVIHKKNGGVSSARNIALQKADGEYIVFLDADDYLTPEAIEIMVKNIEKKGADWVSFQYANIDERGNDITGSSFISGDFYFASDDDRFLFLINEVIPYNVGVEVFKIFKKKIIDDNEIRFDEQCRIGEDYSFTIKYLIHAEKVTAISDALYIHRIRNGSAMHVERNYEEILSDRVLMLNDIWNHIVLRNNKFFKYYFPIILILLMHDLYIGHNATEVSKILQNLKNEFIVDRYKDIAKIKGDYLKFDKSKISRIRFRYNMYIMNFLNGFTISERAKLLVYNAYRKIKGREPMEEWVMPY